MVGENEFDYLYESTKDLLAPLRQLLLSLTADFSQTFKTYLLVGTIVLPPIIFGAAWYFQDDESGIEKKKRLRNEAAAKKSK
mmetsp:Transcript_26607/g.65233  ORF Transcript_26607/g.65233 Transcript_26607/m.65233 type:complete len:82 (-) Transcript_26607:76-321(-)